MFLSFPSSVGGGSFRHWLCTLLLVCISLGMAPLSTTGAPVISRLDVPDGLVSPTSNSQLDSHTAASEPEAEESPLRAPNVSPLQNFLVPPMSLTPSWRFRPAERVQTVSALTRQTMSRSRALTLGLHAAYDVCREVATEILASDQRVMLCRQLCVDAVGRVLKLSPSAQLCVAAAGRVLKSCGEQLETVASAANAAGGADEAGTTLNEADAAGGAGTTLKHGAGTTLKHEADSKNLFPPPPTSPPSSLAATRHRSPSPAIVLPARPEGVPEARLGGLAMEEEVPPPQVEGGSGAPPGPRGQNLSPSPVAVAFRDVHRRLSDRAEHLWLEVLAGAPVLPLRGGGRRQSSIDEPFSMPSDGAVTDASSVRPRSSATELSPTRDPTVLYEDTLSSEGEIQRVEQVAHVSLDGRRSVLWRVPSTDSECGFPSQSTPAPALGGVNSNASLGYTVGPPMPVSPFLFSPQAADFAPSGSGQVRPHVVGRPAVGIDAGCAERRAYGGVSFPLFSQQELRSTVSLQGLRPAPAASSNTRISLGANLGLSAISPPPPPPPLPRRRSGGSSTGVSTRTPVEPQRRYERLLGEQQRLQLPEPTTSVGGSRASAPVASTNVVDTGVPAHSHGASGSGGGKQGKRYRFWSRKQKKRHPLILVEGS